MNQEILRNSVVNKPEGSENRILNPSSKLIDISANSKIFGNFDQGFKFMRRHQPAEKSMGQEHLSSGSGVVLP